MCTVTMETPAGRPGGAGRWASGLAGRQAGRVKMLPRSALAWIGGGGGIARSRGASDRAGGEASTAGSPGTPSVVAFLSLDRGER